MLRCEVKFLLKLTILKDNSGQKNDYTYRPVEAFESVEFIKRSKPYTESEPGHRHTRTNRETSFNNHFFEKVKAVKTGD